MYGMRFEELARLLADEKRVTEFLYRRKKAIAPIACPRCGRKRFYTMGRKRLRCRGCGRDHDFLRRTWFGRVRISYPRWLMPVVENRRIKRATRTVYGYQMKDVSFNLVIGLYKWATSLACVSSRLVKMYADRWGIETGYRVKKEFRIRTTTKDAIKKMMVFFIQVLHYNSWTMENSLNGFGCWSKDEGYMTVRMFKMRMDAKSPP